MEIELNDCLFNRDEKGGLIPITDTIKVGKKEKEDIILRIKYKPVTRGQYYNLMQIKEKGEATEKDIDRNLISECLVEPKFTKEQINDMKPTIFTAIITRIMAASFSVADDLYKDNSVEELDELKKKS